MALTLNTRNRTLSSDSCGFTKKIQCPLNKQWDDLQLVDASERYGDDFSSVTQERHRHCFSCQRNVFNLDGLSEAQIEAAIMANPKICIHATLPHPAIVVEGMPEGSHYDLILHKPNCPKIDDAYLNHGLKEVRTARSLAALNLAVKEGLNIQLVQLKSDVSLERSFFLVEHDDGTFSEIVDYRSILMPGSHDKAIIADHYFSQYRYCFDKPWAAYLLPADIEEGDQVFIWDVIQDQEEIRMNHGGSIRRKQGIATWVGGELIMPAVEPDIWIG